jgi:hypothetical protein
LDWPPVDPDELAYALTIFVGAANRTLQFSVSIDDESQKKCRCLFEALMMDNDPVTIFAKPIDETQRSLPAAFGILWNNYETDHLQSSICARGLGFYLLMERTEGRFLATYVELCPESPETVLLDLAVVRGLASVSLLPEGHLPEFAFMDEIKIHAASECALPCSA